jgi:DNA (cytosine-5)-methyltransferase 1
VDNPKTLTHISLCAGYGGIDLGLSRALGAMRTIAFSEIEAFAAENLVAKMEAGWLDAAPIWTNLKTFPWERFRDKVDILSGGFPCQPFSSAGRRAGDDDPRHLWPHIVKGIKRLGRPSLVFFENVEGIISSKLKSDGWADPAGTPVLLHVLRELERVGYQAAAGVFSAREIGAPHQRKRVFIMGVRSDLSNTGRALVTEMLSATERGDVGNASHWGGQGAFGRGRSKQKRSQAQDRESSTAYPAPRGAERGDVGDTKSGTQSRRKYRLHKSKKLQKNRHTARHTSSSCTTAYPAPRGAEQYGWEPPRVTVGNTLLGDAQNSNHVETRFDRQNRDGSASLHNNASLNGFELGNAQQQRSQGPANEGRKPPRERLRTPTARSCGFSLDNANGERLQGFLLTTEPRKPDHENEKSVTRSGTQGELHRQAKPSMGGDADGAPSWMDYAELCGSVDNRTDELRLLGNGVVPATAERAFRVLWDKIK